MRYNEEMLKKMAQAENKILLDLPFSFPIVIHLCVSVDRRLSFFSRIFLDLSLIFGGCHMALKKFPKVLVETRKSLGSAFAFMLWEFRLIISSLFYFWRLSSIPPFQFLINSSLDMIQICSFILSKFIITLYSRIYWWYINY